MTFNQKARHLRTVLLGAIARVLLSCSNNSPNTAQVKPVASPQAEQPALAPAQ